MHVMPLLWGVTLTMMEQLEFEDAVGLGKQYNTARERLAIPLTLLYALQSLPDRRLIISQRRRLDKLTSLTVHVVCSSPLFSSESWEIFMHRLPKLKHLNVVFVVQGRPFKQYFFSLNSQISLHRCNDC